MFTLGERLGIDLGTATIVVYAHGRGIVVREPSVVATDGPDGRVLRWGSAGVLGQWATSRNALRDGVIGLLVTEISPTRSEGDGFPGTASSRWR